MPLRQPDISIVKAAVRVRARGPRRSTKALEPAVVLRVVEAASPPSNETSTIVRGRRGSRTSTRASSIRIPTPPPSS